jgi:hypothetical protein
MLRVALSLACLCLLPACAERRTELDDGLLIQSPAPASAINRSHGAFVRVGVMMNADRSDALELRTSIDGVTWTDWQPLTIVFAEGEAFAGHVDAPFGSRHFEHRFTDPNRPPRWLLVEDIEAIGEPSVLLEPELEVPPREPGVGRRVDALAPFPTILPRSAWGARAPTCRSLTSPYRMVVHHTASPTNDPSPAEVQLRQTQAYHMDSRGYCDVAYNFLMSRDARVWEGRGDGVLGGHTLNQNAGNMALCIIGTYTTDTLTPQQACAAAGWMAWQSTRHGIALNRTNIKGHREWGSTACPGNTVFAQLDALVNQAATTCAGVTPPRPDWAAEFVAQSLPLASTTIRLELGETRDGWFDLRNSGARSWTTTATRLAPTPRDRASALADSSWLSPTRVSNVDAATATGQVGRFRIRVRGNTLGTFSQTFGLVHETVAWFSDHGGPPDSQLQLRVEVVPRTDAGRRDAGVQAPDAGVPELDAGLPQLDAGAGEPDGGGEVDLEGEPVAALGTADLPAAKGCGCDGTGAPAVILFAGLLFGRRRW